MPTRRRRSRIAAIPNTRYRRAICRALSCSWRISEILQEQDSARQIASRYRVFGMAAILERRRRVGMLYVIRHGGVEFVFPQTSKTSSSLSAGGVSSPGDVSTPGDDTSSGAELSPGDRPSTIPGDRLTADPGDAVSPLLRTTRNPVGTSTASAIIA